MVGIKVDARGKGEMSGGETRTKGKRTKRGGKVCEDVAARSGTLFPLTEPLASRATTDY